MKSSRKKKVLPCIAAGQARHTACSFGVAVTMPVLNATRHQGTRNCQHASSQRRKEGREGKDCQRANITELVKEGLGRVGLSELHKIITGL